MGKRDGGKVSSLMCPVLLGLTEIPKLQVVFVAHDRVFAGEESDDEDMVIEPSVGPRCIPSVASVMNAAVNVIGSTFIRERVIKTKTKKGKKREKRVVEYCLRVGPHAYYTTKIRKPKSVELPSSLVDPTYEKILALSGETKE